MNKSAVRDEIVAQLRAELALQTRAAHSARDEAISEESRAENKYDTHSQEAAYLAEGQARLAAEIAENLELYAALNVADLPVGSPVALGALVCLDTGGEKAWYFIGPRAGGLDVQIEGVAVLVLTPHSPLGRELMGKRVGDGVRLPNSRPGTAASVVAIT